MRTTRAWVTCLAWWAVMTEWSDVWDRADQRTEWTDLGRIVFGQTVEVTVREHAVEKEDKDDEAEAAPFDFTTTMLYKGRRAIALWALGREGEVQRRGLRAVMRDLCQTPDIHHIDLERMTGRLNALYGKNGTRDQWTKAYRRVDRVLEL